MDPSSIETITSSEFGEDGEPQPAENITYMDVALCMAAAKGKIEEFSNFKGSELESLRTPNHDTVLHVNFATDELFSVLGLDGFLPSLLRFLLEFYGIRLMVYLISRVVERVQIGSWSFETRSNFVEQILNKCPSLRLQANAKGQTPLHIAAMYGHSAIVKFLINHAKAPHGDSENPGMNQLEAVREMLRKADLESNTAFHVAAQYGHVRVVQELLEFEDPDFPYSVNRNQESPLYIAARRRDGPLLTTIFGRLKSTAHGGPHGRTALHAAAMAGDAGATKIILKNKGNLTRETDENGQTPLHYAAHLGHRSVVKELLKWDKFAAYIADKKLHMTPLLMAARQGHGGIVREIISICPDCCDKVDKKGWNFLHFVAFRNSPAHLNFLCFRGYGKTLHGSVRNLIHAEDGNGITPQHVYDATLIRTVAAPNLSDIYNLRKEKMEQIKKFLEDIVKEEVAEKQVRPIPMPNVSTHSVEKARETQLIVATLIATVTFAAAIAVPGGYKTENGSDQGTPFLIRDGDFRVFVITNALAFIFSLTNVALHFEMTIPFLPISRDTIPLQRATNFLFGAIWALLIAFITGTYAILKPSPEIAIPSCCMGFIFVFCFIMYRGNRSQ